MGSAYEKMFDYAFRYWAPCLKRNMIKGKLLRQTLDKFLKNSEVAKEARVQVCLPNGELYDITGIDLMENKLIGNRESHRLVITIDKEKWTMGKVMKRV